MSNKKKLTRGSVAAIAGIGVVVGMIPAVTANASPEPGGDNGPEISTEVTAELEATGSADVWLTLNDQADLSAAETMSWEDRGDYVYDTLRAHAAESQADLVADLEASGADYQTFWISNSIFVRDASADLVSQVASGSTLSSVTPDRTPVLIDGAPAAEGEVNSTAPLATEWGLDSIGAPEVWDTYGTTGEGIVVGTFDTGADTSHPALNAAYRGTETGSHDYNWFDSTGASATPVDHGEAINVPHGTHVTGTMVGEDGANQIGVAPGAKFIVAAGCCVDQADVFETFEWFVAPTPVGSDEGDASKRPHIVNNSWGFVNRVTDPILANALNAWDAAGIFGTFATGNAGSEGPEPGPVCDNVNSPAWNNEAHYAVGNYQQNGEIAPSSSRGPGQDGQPGVDIAAPGTNIRSAVPGGYESWTGTSMATPHVSGAVALLWSHYPELVGNQEATIAALDATAIDTAAATCGGDAANNETWGEGQIDLVAAFESLEEEPPADAPEVTRAAGADRYETAGAVSELFGDDVDTVYLASGQNYPDAVTGSPAAAQGKLAVAGTLNTPEGNPAPVLLARSDRLTNATTAALTELAPSNVIILGGESIINAEVEATLAEDYTVTRVAGADRYSTAANLAKMFTGTDTVYVAAGTDNAFSDALTSSALAGAENAPVLLTKPDQVPNVTAAAIEELAPSQIIVIGGTATISDEVYAELGATGRLGGANKFETAAVISAEFGTDVPLVYVASANDYPDALASSALAGSQGAPVIVVKGTHDPAEDKIPAVIENALKTLSPEQVVIVGGTNAVDGSVQAWIEDPANWG